MKRYLLFILLLSTFAWSCQEDDTKSFSVFDSSQPLITTVQGKSFDMLTFEMDFTNFWNTYVQNYGWELICSCECEGVEYIPQLFEDHAYLLGDSLNITIDTSLSCEELFGIFKTDCGFESVSDYRDSTLTMFAPSDTITGEEISLITNLVDDAITNGTIDIVAYRTQWNNLSTQSLFGNVVSLATIEYANAIQSYVTNPNVDFPEEIEPEAFIAWHIIGGLRSAGAYLILNAGYCGATGNGDEDFGRAVAISFIIGAAT